jgi:trehalose synthase-fused probable maltokinase
MSGKRRVPARGPGARAARDLLARAAAALPEVLPTQRWFGAKARRIAAVRPRDHAVVPETDGTLALFQVDFADGGSDVYCIPVRPGTGRAAFRDALDDPGFSTALLAAIRQGDVLRGQHGAFRFAPTEAAEAFVPVAPREVAPIGGEQSNTSVVFDRAAILKLYRKVEPGESPEAELTGFLTGPANFRGAARLGGSVAYEVPGEAPITVAVLAEFVANQGDAWTAIQARLREYYATAGASGQTGGEPDLPFARTLAAADAKEASRLGELTGRLHLALASGPPGTPLGPEPITAADLATWRAGIEARFDGVVRDLEAALSGLPPGVAEAARAALDEASRLRDGLTSLEALSGAGVSKIRVHGDYHLGQVLQTPDGFVILDFEGEPARSLAERRAKHCALKDVAGMLRSYDYAARSALAEIVARTPDDPGLASRLAPWAETWAEGVRAAFLNAYLADTWAHGVPFLPRAREALEAALRVYELDKAIYEVGYELHHRPAWLPLPLDALRRLTTSAPRPPAGRLRPDVGPFSFTACLQLREFVGVRAENERQLAELIEEVPLDSIYYHTHGFFLRHKFIAGAYPNDFATWVAIEVRDRVLGERLAMVDPVQFPDLQALREELASVIDDHLRSLPLVPGAVLGEPFDFMQSRIVEIPTGIEIRTLAEFREALLEVDLSALYYHLVEARIRLGRGQNDFAAWLERGLGLPALAARARALDPYVVSLERTRARLIELCDESLAEGTGR